MTNKSFHWNKNKPFLLKPAGKDYLWGGTRLNDDFSKGISVKPLAETWECSTHPEGLSMAANGEFEGQSLAEVLREHPEFLGAHGKKNGELPILIKLIDAREDLSIQVHPDDGFAEEYENGQSGKTEFWYVLDAARDASLVYGLHHDVSREDLRESIVNGTIEKYLQKVSIKKDDMFYVKAGTIHAIGAGVLIAEIQENSNLTYRLYDYDRVDKDGNKRKLHIEKALKAANLSSSTEPKQPLRVLKYRRGCAMELLCRCKYFEVHRMLLNTERCRSMLSYQSDHMSFRVLLCISGCGAVTSEDGELFPFFKGDCIFVPADSVKMKLHGKAQFLDVRG